ncbi:MAG: Asp23/Gls24 family envelope stress response protein [bacterium]
MTQMQDEPLTGDLPVSPTPFGDEARPSLSHEVVARYVADAARSVHGIVELHSSAWKGLSSRVREMHTGGVVIRDAQPGSVDVEIHARVAWGVVIPELARDVEEAVRQRVSALLDLDLRTVTLFVDEIAGPAEVGTPKEG